MINGVTKHFMFRIRWISILKFLYFNFFSDSFCITFLSDGIATSISKQNFIFLVFNYYVGPICQNPPISLCPLIPVISSCWNTGSGMWDYQFSVVLIPNVLHIE
jgi:hypothetical protein